MKWWNGLFLGLTLLTSSSNAEESAQPQSSLTLTFLVPLRNDAARPPPDYRHVQVQLWSQNRRGHSWGPFNPVSDGTLGWINITCKQDEYICFGAWLTDDRSVQWGMGHSRRRCENCCYFCTGQSNRSILLSPTGKEPDSPGSAAIPKHGPD
jgi:hypothetical protein